MSEEEIDAPAPARIAPRLVYLAAFSAIAYLLVPRILVPASVGRVSHQALLQLLRGGEFLLNLAALSGAYALVACVWYVVRTPRVVGITAKLLIAGCAGLFVPTVFHAMVTARDRIPWPLLALSIFSGTLLQQILVSTALRARLFSKYAPAFLAALAAGVCSLIALACELSPALVHKPWAPSAANAARQIGEVACLTAPLLLLIPLVPDRRNWPDFGPFLLAIGAAIVTSLALGTVATHLGHGLPDVMYFAQRVGLVFDEAPRIYMGALSFGIAIACGLLTRARPADRLLGAGSLLFLAAGFSPRAPSQLLFSVLAAACFLRAAIATKPSPPLPQSDEVPRG